MQRDLIRDKVNGDYQPMKVTIINIHRTSVSTSFLRLGGISDNATGGLRCN